MVRSHPGGPNEMTIEEADEVLGEFLVLVKSKNKSFSKQDVEEIMKLGSPLRLHIFNGFCRLPNEKVDLFMDLWDYFCDLDTR
jgi:hypothetical protein